MFQGLQDQRARLIDAAIFCAVAGLDEQSLSCRFMVLTLLCSRLRLFCFRKRQGQRSNSLVNKRVALIDT
ncbi:hypothetical protein SynA1544_00045 [Synechococcus sp. A15-44]|nr:hypothetical protein SynA1544_00045 [Synechococcus sp. A15-44]